MKVESGVVTYAGEPLPVTDRELRMNAITSILSKVSSLNIQGNMDLRSTYSFAVLNNISPTGRRITRIILPQVTQRQFDDRVDPLKNIYVGQRIRFPVDIAIEVPTDPSEINLFTACHITISDRDASSSIAGIVNSVGHNMTMIGGAVDTRTKRLRLSKPLTLLKTVERLLAHKIRDIGTPR